MEKNKIHIGRKGNQKQFVICGQEVGEILKNFLMCKRRNSVIDNVLDELIPHKIDILSQFGNIFQRNS